MKSPLVRWPLAIYWWRYGVYSREVGIAWRHSGGFDDWKPPVGWSLALSFYARAIVITWRVPG